MGFEYPDDRRYLETHEWITTSGETRRVGITDFAQDELGDVVFVELPDEGEQLEQDEQFGVIESIKAVSDLYAPVGGEVVATNEEVVDSPELVNEDPYDEGWMLEVSVDDPDELDGILAADEYRNQVE
jgi:glycine cleavage system H protein